MSVRIESTDGIMRARLKGEIDHHLAGGLRAELDDAIIREKPRALLLDFTDVSFMDSSGIGLVMGRYRLMNENGGEVEVVNPSPQIKKVMRLAGLDRLARFS